MCACVRACVRVCAHVCLCTDKYTLTIVEGLRHCSLSCEYINGKYNINIANNKQVSSEKTTTTNLSMLIAIVSTKVRTIYETCILINSANRSSEKMEEVETVAEVAQHRGYTANER